MIGGFATMAGGVLAAYVDMGISAKHLLSASVMAAPAGLMVAKILQPEIDEPKTLGKVRIDVRDPSANVLEAVANGTVGGLQLALNVGAMLLVFLALIALINLIIGWVGAQFGYVAYVPQTPEPYSWQWLQIKSGLTQPPPDKVVYLWSLEGALGWVFQPFAWLMGIEWQDCRRAGELLGLKMGANEFVAYGRLAEWSKADATIISDRTQAILTYALCGFANFSSIGIQLGGIGGMAPERRGDLARLGLRAMLGGTLVAFINACVANIML
jgi:CNT family concentrative nucleoside transporter